jgi:hypothetical protein
MLKCTRFIVNCELPVMELSSVRVPVGRFDFTVYQIKRGRFQCLVSFITMLLF